ncbi:TetR/AcrR family transcriptional regulator [Occallatibacter savannae]|uniref:TetR/AcrR family transcriptional regulator n=1 Tax=Occallatibacter savannae TaxID=1002691 RepID=UPI000D6942E0|nr:TetR/AcrR family transcriptional regulator [Occallatibacter savannae]
MEIEAQTGLAGGSDRSAETRGKILDAAVQEFSANGLAGARMDQIASVAGVNKALLYYHFDSKENLYSAALEMISTKTRDATMATFLRDASPGERVLRSALGHFDRILAQTEFQSLMQQEMMRLHKGESGAMDLLIKRVFAPMLAMYQSMVREGIASGELIDTDWLQIHLASLGTNVFYFMSSQLWRELLPYDPFSPEVLAERRKTVVHFLGLAIFRDRERGAELAEKVLADTPMPEIRVDKSPFGVKHERKK